MLKIEIYNADCFDVFENFKSKKRQFDLILADPPFGTMQDFVYKNKITTTGKIDWDVKLDTGRMFENLSYVTRKNGRIILFSQGDYTTELRSQTLSNITFNQGALYLKNESGNILGCKKGLVNVFEDINIYKQETDVFKNCEIREYARKILDFTGCRVSDVYRKLGHRGAQNFLQPDAVYINMCSEKTYNDMIEKLHINKMDGFLTYEELKAINQRYRVIFNLGGRSLIRNVFKYKKEIGYHQTQKPVPLLQELTCIYSDPGDTVLDFTAGSGSTAVACIREGRNCVCIEKAEKYCEIIKKRVNEEIEKSGVDAEVIYKKL